MNYTERKFYNYWRIRILISIILGYATYYLCRQNFSMITPSLIEEFHYTKTQIGWILTLSSIVYGVGKLINGYISDRSNARYFITLGLLGSSIITILLGFADNIMYLGVFWIINNWLQSMGWPPSARILTHWFAERELGKKWALGTASHQIGGGVAIIFAGYLVEHYGWRYAFFFPGAVSFIIACLLFQLLRVSPKELNLPTVEIYKAHSQDMQLINNCSNNSVDSVDNVDSEDVEYLGDKEILYKVFVNKKMWYLCFANMCIYIVRNGIVFWGALFLVELQNISLSSAGWQIASYEFIGLFGGIIAGFLSDSVPKGKRSIVASIFMMLLVASLCVFWKTLEYNNYIGIIAFSMIGFFVAGPHILIGVISAELTSKKAVGTANGFVGIMGYIGSSLSGVSIGLIVDHWGWAGVFVFFMSAAMAGVGFFVLTLSSVKTELCRFEVK